MREFHVHNLFKKLAESFANFLTIRTKNSIITVPFFEEVNHTMSKKSTKVAYLVACAAVVVLLVILGITYKDAPILVE